MNEVGKKLETEVAELTQQVVIGKEKVKLYNAAIKAILSMEDPEKVWQTKMVEIEKAIDTIWTAWHAYARLGELLGEPKKGKKLSNIFDNFSRDDRHFARGFAGAKADGIIDTIADKLKTDVKDILGHIKEDHRMNIVKFYTPYLRWKRKHDDSEPMPDPPAGLFNVIMIDLPWPISKSDWDIKWHDSKTIMDKYPRMSIEKMKEMPVKSKANNNCGLFLWTTHTFLPHAFQIMNAWKFKYHCTITWDKGSGFTLFGFHRRTEFCLFGYCGKLDHPKGQAIPTLIQEKSRGHSQKPLILYEHIERRWKESRLDVFPGDERREGWKRWGKSILETY